jgi:hypothetical protein
VFEEKTKITARDAKFVNLLVDAGTVNGIKFVHALIANPSLLPEGISLGPYEIGNWEAGECWQFFNETVEWVL